MASCSAANHGADEIIGAAIEGDAARVRTIVEGDRKLANVRGSFIDSTPLIFAAHRGHLGVVEVLLAAGADVEAREGASHTTALHWAAEGGHPDVVVRLLDAKAELEPRDEWYDLAPLGWTTFVSCAPKRHKDRTGARRILRDRGADVDPFTAIASGELDVLSATLVRDRTTVSRRLGFVAEGKTPLHVASERGATTFVARLVEAKADLTALTLKGQSALALAIEADRSEAAAVLRDAGAAIDVSAAVALNDRGRARALIEKDPRMIARGGRFEALLHTASARGLDWAVELLLELGASPDAAVPALLSEIRSATTPLHEASERGHLAVVTRLLDAGADPNAAAPATAQTPLHRAAIGGHRAIAELLIARGADRTLRDRQHDSSPAGWAEFANHVDLAKVLAPPS